MWFSYDMKHLFIYLLHFCSSKWEIHRTFLISQLSEMHNPVSRSWGPISESPSSIDCNGVNLGEWSVHARHYSLQIWIVSFRMSLYWIDWTLGNRRLQKKATTIIAWHRVTSGWNRKCYACHQVFETKPVSYFHFFSVQKTFRCFQMELATDHE